MIYILRLAKAEQLGLFDSIVHVAPHVRKDGTYVGQHERHQKVRQRDLFADHPAPEKPKPKASSKARRLISYVAGKGGPERMGAMLRAQPAAVTDRLVLGFTAETGLPEFEVRSILGLGGDQKAEKQPEPAPDQEPIKNETPADAGPAAETAPADQEPVKESEPVTVQAAELGQEHAIPPAPKESSEVAPGTEAAAPSVAPER